MLMFCFLLIAEIPMLALKFRNMSWQDNRERYVFLLGCLPILAFDPTGLYLIILWYILLSAVFPKITKG